VYELFVLGELMDKPLHGYVLHAVIGKAIGPIRQMSWGALYPLIRRLEQGGLIVREESGGGGGRERKMYRITDAGRERFYLLMDAADAYDADYPDLFTIKMSNFHHVDRDQRLAILRHYRGYVRFVHDYMQTSRRHVALEPGIPEAERPHIRRALEHRLHVAEADTRWIDAEIERLSGEDSASLQHPGS